MKPPPPPEPHPSKRASMPASSSGGLHSLGPTLSKTSSMPPNSSAPITLDSTASLSPHLGNASELDFKSSELPAPEPQISNLVSLAPARPPPPTEPHPSKRASLPARTAQEAVAPAPHLSRHISSPPAANRTDTAISGGSDLNPSRSVSQAGRTPSDKNNRPAPPPGQHPAVRRPGSDDVEAIGPVVPGQRPVHAMKAVKSYNPNQRGPPLNIEPPKVFRPASEFARDMAVTEEQTPRVVVGNDTEAADEQERIANFKAEALSKVPYIGTSEHHEVDLRTVDELGRVMVGQPAPPARPPRIFRPTLDSRT